MDEGYHSRALDKLCDASLLLLDSLTQASLQRACLWHMQCWACTEMHDPHLHLLLKLWSAGASSLAFLKGGNKTLEEITFSFKDLTGRLYFFAASPAYSCSTTAFSSSTTASGPTPNL